MEITDPIKQTIGKALGRVPSGVFIVTAEHNGTRTAMMASWVQQASFQPPCVSIAMAKERPIARLIRDSGKLAISIVGESDTALMKRYARGVKPDEDAFSGVSTRSAPSGLPILTDAIAWLDCRLVNTLEFNADHELLVAEITAGELLKDQPSFKHQRGNGFHY